MKKIQSFAMLMGIALTGTMLFTACSSVDPDEEKIVYDDNGQAGVKSEFVISIPRKVISITRQGDDVVQKVADPDLFRGMDNIRLIPFTSEPTKTSSKLADIMELSAVVTGGLGKPGSINYKVYSDQFVPVGTKNFLFYGRAIADEEDTEVSTMDDMFKYGILNVQGLEESTGWTPNNVLFSLKQINTSSAAQAGDATGQRIVSFLTDLANMTATASAPHDKWRTSNDPVMAALYKKITSITTSSSNTVAVILSKLYFALDPIQSGHPAFALRNAIRSKILEACSTPTNGEPAPLKAEYSGYPGNIGLPDGAVRVRWNSYDNSFTDITAEYGKGYGVNITDYCYPAALWYFANTPLKAANEKKSLYYDEQSSWDGVINTVYKETSDEVVAGTQSVALKKAAEYGVGRLETRIMMADGDFYDGNGNVVNIGTGYKMKGLLLGGQSSVGFDFTKKGSENKTIYDSKVTNNIIANKNYTTSYNQTLALETGNSQTVYAALELVNGGDEFMGADGYIPAGGTFYLAVKLDPAEAINKAEVGIDQIIKQDYVTSLTITIKNGGTSVDRDNDGNPDKYVKDSDGKPIGVDTGDGETKTKYDINDDGIDDTFITDPAHGGPGWDTDGDGEVDLPLVPDGDGNYPDSPTIPEGLGNATNGIPDMTSPGVELGTSVDLEWKRGLIISPNI